MQSNERCAGTRLARLNLNTEACRVVPMSLMEICYSHVWQIANQLYRAKLAQVIIRSKMWYRNFDPSMYRSKNDNVAIRKPKRAVLCACAEHPCRLVSCAMRKGSTNAANKQRFACCRPKDGADAKHQGVKREHDHQQC